VMSASKDGSRRPWIPSRGGELVADGGTAVADFCAETRHLYPMDLGFSELLSNLAEGL